MGAALAYYTMFSLAPLLLIVISVAGLYFGESAARGEIENQLRFMMGEAGAKAVLGLLGSVQNPAQSVAASVLGLLLLLVGATTVFGELHVALDRIWRVPACKHSRSIVTLIRTRILSFGMILTIGFLLMVSLVMSTVLAMFGSWLALATIVDALAGYLLVTLMFALIYKIMPSARVHWRDVWIGSVFTALLFTIGKWLIGYYIGHSGVVTGFGAAGSLVVVLIWVYYSAQIFLIGAEFTWIYANAHGSRKPLLLPNQDPV
jgi:membrane protein